MARGDRGITKVVGTVDGIGIVFLDLDGVLCTPKSTKAGGYKALDHQCVRVLNKFMLRYPEARIIISSTWRLNSPLRQIRSQLDTAGFRFSGLIIGKTTNKTEFAGRLYRSRPRGLEIDHWLKRHTQPLWFAIIDDEPDMGVLQTYLVQTYFETGLQSHHLELLDLLVQWQKEAAAKAVGA